MELLVLIMKVHLNKEHIDLWLMHQEIMMISINNYLIINKFNQIIIIFKTKLLIHIN